MDAARGARSAGHRIVAAGSRLGAMLDDANQLIAALQGMYYGIFTLVAATLISVPGFDAEYVDMTIGGFSYNLWLWLTLVCPSLTLIGRRFTIIAARRGPGEPNPGVAGAQLQLTGDGGVWGAIMIYAWGLVQTDWWKHHLYTSGFILMGVLGGSMFTVRSLRRVGHLARRNRRVKKHGWG